jgi:cell division protein FtsL
MPTEVITALIAGIVSIIGSSITLLIGMRNIRLEREKLRNDRERLQLELRKIDEQSRISKVEIERLQAEAAKLAAEAEEIRRKRIEAQRAEIRDVLILFDRAVFDAPMYSEEPVEMFKAIRQTRLSLQMSGASLIHDQKVAEHFRRIREILLNVESEVQRRYPVIAQMAVDFDDNREAYERRREVSKILGKEYWKAVNFMMGIRSEVQQHLESIRQRLHELDAYG